MTAKPDRAVDQHAALFDALTEYRTKVQSYADAFAEVLPVLRCGGSPDGQVLIRGV